MGCCAVNFTPKFFKPGTLMLLTNVFSLLKPGSLRAAKDLNIFSYRFRPPPKGLLSLFSTKSASSIIDSGKVRYMSSIGGRPSETTRFSI